MQEYDGPALAMGVMADQHTSSWGCAAKKDLSSEPRRGWVNSNRYSYYPIVRDYWGDCYKTITGANDVLRIVESEKFADLEDAEGVVGSEGAEEPK